ncbi:MAG: chitobiase/beta-hexosaminidase C-terminal domain-containing protein [Terracidiphilus sp.]
MNLLRFFIRVVLFTALNIAVAAALAAPSNPSSPAAASQVAPRVQSAVDDAARVVLRGNTHPQVQAAAGHAGSTLSIPANSATDLGAVDDSLPAGRMLLLLQRSPEQEAALADFIQAAHTPGSSTYHQWLKPADFGRLYGPTDSDLAAVTAWLQSHGLTVNQVHAGRLAIEFSGTAGQVSEAFQTQIHRYQVNGEMHLANSTDPSVPIALAPVIAGLARLNDFHPQPRLQVLGQAQFNSKTHQATPLWTYPQNGGVVFVMAPGDFAKQYDIPAYSTGIIGSGQSIAIISESNVDLSLVQAYQSLFGLTANLPTVIVDGADPGQNSAATEAYLDIELAGSVAPGATVLLYTSGGTALSDGLALAAMRAVEDDQAGVISVSYGECEMELGQGGNTFWSALWQQAATQGQTVFVSSGDGGSAGCDNFNAQQAAYGGLQVNGIASTPYNVAVGGTDFYYNQYAGTSSAISSQLSTYWSTTSTATPAVSLKQTIPEQAWNDFFGFNMYDSGNPALQPGEMIIAGGGGASSAALYPSGIATGYPKPAWQTGTGVPTDHVRDLPDISLFAANGYNYSFYPICASPGDCSNLTNSGTVVITGVGGTSASSPAMAAIQALINQSTGAWAGQANFIYYPLAVKQPSAFHDVTVGGNQVLCYPSTTNCVTGTSASNSTGFYVENGYSASTGYDLATGLGSIDVANLIKFWNSVTFTPTATTLSVSPASLVHGNTATVSGSVARSSGSGTPTGSVSLTGNDGIPHYTAIDDIALSAGSFYASVDNLPGGTYQLTALYGGDGTYAASKSAPVTVTVTPENNTLATTGWAWNPYDLNLYALSSGITLPYGAQIFLDAQPVSANATIATEPTPATGTVTFSDKLGSATISSTQPLNAAGVAEWSTGVFAPGNHSVSESYSGDLSYNPSSVTTAASFTVIPGSTSLTIMPLVTSVAAGASLTVDVLLTTGYLSLYGALPTGNVTVTLGTQSISAPWQPYGKTGNASLEAVVTFSNLPAGILPLNAYYQGDSNWLGSYDNAGTIIALSSKLTPAVVLTTSSASPAPSQNFTLTATVAGVSGKPNPTGTVTFFSDGQSLSAYAVLSNGTATLTIPGYSAANGTNIFTAFYQGDANYNAAVSNAVNVTITQSDFSLNALIPEAQISPSGSATSTLSLAPINNFNGTVTLSATAPAGITVTPAAASLALSAPATDVLTLKVAAATAPGIYPLIITASGGGHVHTAQILVRVLAVAAPLFSLTPGTFATAQQVTLTDATGGATIYYTTNGAIPTASSTRYTCAITVSATETIQAIAVVSGYAPSTVSSATYTIETPAATPILSLASGIYSAVQIVTITDTTPGAAIYYTTNGTAPSTSSTLYTGAITVSTSEPIEAIAAASGSLQSATASAMYIINMAVNGCPTGSGSCVDNFTGTSGTLLPAYNSKWVLAGGTNSIYTTGANSAQVSGSASAVYYYSASSSDTSQITAAPSSTTIGYEKLACVRVSSGIPGYCVGFSAASSGNYTACYVMKNFKYLGGGSCGTVSATASHTLGLVASGTSTVTLSVYFDGVLKGTLTDSSSPYTIAGSGFGLQGDGTPADSTVDEWQDYSGISPVPAPIFTPASGTYTSAQSVTIADTAPGAAIYYTTNGTTPTTNSTLYTGAIPVSASEIIEAIATAPGYTQSGVGSATYIISPPFFGCPAGSGSCVDNFTGTSGTLLPTYNSRWTLAAGTNSIYTSGVNSAQVSGSAGAVYYYNGSVSDTAQITLAPSSTTIGYEKLACVRVSSGIAGYCVGFSAVSSGNYSACYVMKNFKYLGTGSCGTISATATHTLGLVASGTSTVSLSIYVDGVSKGTVTDSSSPYTIAGSGFGLQGDGTPADSTVNEWQDYSGGFPAATPTFSPAAGAYTSAQTVTISDTTSNANIYYTTNGSAPTTSSTLYSAPITVSASETVEAIAVASGYLQSSVGSAAYTINIPAIQCPSGSGSCSENFTGASGTLLPAYNSKWVLAGGTNSIYTTGANSAQVSGSASSVYYYSASSSNTSQITLAPSSTTIGYEKLACVRVSGGIAGYCVGFSAASSGNYSACYVMKNFKYLDGGSCGTVSATATHTLALVASGTSTVSLSVYVDGVLKGTVTDSSNPYTVAGSGFGLQGDGTPADSTINEWQDYSGSSPAPSLTISPGTGTSGVAHPTSISNKTPTMVVE